MGEAFAQAGFEVWVTDVDAAALAECPSEWTARRVDASDENQMRALFGEISVAGGLDVVCANAGVAGPTAPVEDVAWDDWKACVGVTLGSAFLVRNTQHL